MAGLRPKIRFFLLLVVVGLTLLALRASLEVFDASDSIDDQRAALLGSPYPVLFAYGIRDDWISGDGSSKVVRVPRDLAIEQIYAALVARFLELGGRCLRAERLRNNSRRVIEIGFSGEMLVRITLVPDSGIRRNQGRVAIVVAGLGGSLDTTVKSFLQLQQTVSLSVLPGLRHSRRIAETASADGLDVMAYFAVEPAENDPVSEDFALFADLEASEITRRVRKAMRVLPEATSAICFAGDIVDESLRDALHGALNQENVVLVDRPGTPENDACSGAVTVSRGCFAVDVEVDVVREESEIRARLHRLARLAARKRIAVGLVHPRRQTWRVLQREMTVLRRLGVQFVGISDL